MSYNLYSDFNLALHNKTFICYLEAIMFPDGHIEYAVPSHQEKLIKVYQEQSGLSRKEIFDKCPEEYYFAFDQWLCNETGCTMLWYNAYRIPEQGVTERQIQVFNALKISKAYSGEIPYLHQNK